MTWDPTDRPNDRTPGSMAPFGQFTGEPATSPAEAAPQPDPSAPAEHSAPAPGAPSPGDHGVGAQGGYGASAQGSYGTPAPGPYAAPAQNPYGPPAPDAHGSPAPGHDGSPAPGAYGAPANPAPYEQSAPNPYSPPGAYGAPGSGAPGTPGGTGAPGAYGPPGTPGAPGAYGAPGTYGGPGSGYVGYGDYGAAPGAVPTKKGNGAIIAVVVIALLVIGGAVLAAFLLAGSDDPPAQGVNTNDVSAPTSVYDVDLGVGMCLESLDYDADQQLTVVPCADPHGAEVIAETTLDAGAYPGEDAVLAEAESYCADASADVVGDQPIERAELRLFYPTESTWDAGDRLVSCLARAEAGTTLTGSIVAGDAAEQ